MHQPCPDCGTLMVALDDKRENDGPGIIWGCPACGQTWTDEQIEIVYRLNEIANEKEGHNGPGKQREPGHDLRQP